MGETLSNESKKNFVHSKAVVLLFLIHCLMCLTLFVGVLFLALVLSVTFQMIQFRSHCCGVLCLILFCYALLSVLSSFAIILRELTTLLFFVFYRLCPVALPSGAIG